MQSHFTHHVTGPFCCSSPASTRCGLLTCCLSSAWREKRLWLGGAGHLVSPAPWLCCPGLHPPTICTQQPTRDPCTELSLFSEKKKDKSPPRGWTAASQLPLAHGLQVSDPVTPPLACPFPLLLPVPPAASQGRRRRRRWLCRAGSTPGSAPRTLLCSPPAHALALLLAGVTLEGW